jgi:hypothetical protein
MSFILPPAGSSPCPFKVRLFKKGESEERTILC